VSLLLFLNELSCGTSQSPDRVDAMMEDFVTLLRHVRERRPATSLVSLVRREDLEVAKGYFLTQWIGARPRNKELWRSMKAMQNRAPFGSVLPPGAADRADYRVGKSEALGLGAAHLMDGLLVSLLAGNTWNAVHVAATCDELTEDSDEITTRRVTVRHAAIAEHARFHDAWISRAGLSDFNNGAKIWQARADVYPHLQFLPRVADDLEKLIADWIGPVADRLADLNEAAGRWEPTTTPEPSWLSKVTGEGEIRSRLCWFDDLDGKRRLFDQHARFTPGEGRIHFRLVPEERKVRIAYAGLKLGI
jgi:hypothetical protein